MSPGKSQNASSSSRGGRDRGVFEIEMDGTLSPDSKSTLSHMARTANRGGKKGPAYGVQNEGDDAGHDYLDRDTGRYPEASENQRSTSAGSGKNGSSGHYGRDGKTSSNSINNATSRSPGPSSNMGKSAGKNGFAGGGKTGTSGSSRSRSAQSPMMAGKGKSSSDRNNRNNATAVLL